MGLFGLVENMKELTYIITTYKRKESLCRLIRSINNKCYGEYNILVVIDGDDNETYTSFRANDKIDCILSSKNHECVLQTNLGVYACDTPYFVWLSDDFIIETESFTEKCLESFKKHFPDDIGLLLFKDNVQDGNIAVVGMSSKKFVYEVGGHFQYPEYLHYKGDRELTELARELGMYAYDESLVVPHLHKIVTGKTDLVYEESEENCTQHDLSIYNSRKIDNLFLKNKNYYDFKIRG